jgi:translation initiation factor 3 subunit G
MASLGRWGDEADMMDEDDGDYDFQPDKQVFGPDAKGIKTVIEYKVRDDGAKVKMTTKIRVSKKKKTVSKGVAYRKKLSRFGDAKPENANHNISMVSVEQIFLEKPNLTGQKKKENDSDALATLANQNTSLIVCRICGKKGDHWTSKCPYKDLAAAKGMATGEKLEEESASGDVRMAPKAGAYVAPGMRGGAGEKMGDSMRRPRDENSVRVTNLSEDTREHDLNELFRQFGQISRTFIAYDRETGESRGFAFINFINREDAQKAINALDGHGYDNLILRVEWAAPREERPGGDRRDNAPRN